MFLVTENIAASFNRNNGFLIKPQFASKSLRSEVMPVYALHYNFFHVLSQQQQFRPK
jgi:hypothetical protein